MSHYQPVLCRGEPGRVARKIDVVAVYFRCWWAGCDVVLPSFGWPSSFPIPLCTCGCASSALPSSSAYLMRRGVMVSPWRRSGYVGNVSSCWWACECCPRAFEEVVELNLDRVFEGDGLAEVFSFSLLVAGSRCSSLGMLPCCFFLCF